MNPDLYLHSAFRFDTLAEAACFLSYLSEVDERHAGLVEARLKGRRLEVLVAAPADRKKAAGAIMERLRQLHRAAS